MNFEETSLLTIDGVGPKRIKMLNNIGIHNFFDLLNHYPTKYLMMGPVLKINEINDEKIALISGKVFDIQKKRYGKKIVVKGTIKDRSGEIEGIWFNNPYIIETLQSNTRLFFYCSFAKGERKQIIQPEIINENEIGKLIPQYRLTEGLSQKQIVKFIAAALKKIHLIQGKIPEEIISKRQLITLQDAYQMIHFPDNEEEINNAKERLIYEEFYQHFNSLLVNNNKKGIIINGNLKNFLVKLPFKLTNEQQKALEIITVDMNSGKSMSRLLQGDVGSGKTVIAVAGMFLAAQNGYNAVLLVPTEILAWQHYKNYKWIFDSEGIKCLILTGSSKNKSNVIDTLKCNTNSVVFGTHALLEEGIVFNDLAFVAIDEQHKFGVKQREKIELKGNNPHMLLMSATPIPRSLALTLYGNLDISEIHEIPPGRKGVKTYIVNGSYQKRVEEFIIKEVKLGRQAYIVCPVIEDMESEVLGVETVHKYYSKIPGLKAERIHGSLKDQEKISIMEKFNQGFIDVLISTTVIEVGVDNCNTSLMIVYNGERFGLAQLHQLRGRIGRGQYKGHFIVFSESDSIRLRILKECNDGFTIADKDLEIRGPGEFLGTRQHGREVFKTGILKPSIEFLKKIRDDVLQKP